MVTAAVQCPVITISGFTDVSIQLLERSPVASGIGGVIFKDLLRAFYAALDTQLLTGTGANGQPQGLIGLTGINALTATTGISYRGELASLWNARMRSWDRVRAWREQSPAWSSR